MVRTVDPDGHEARRGAFLDAAERLIRTKGYDRMSVQDVLTDTGTSKGAFYHYFGSKQDLLEAVVERTGDALATRLRSVIDEPGQDALTRLRRYFETLAALKVRQRELLSAGLRTWYSDGNALARQRARADIVERHAPLFAVIVRQGIREGVITASSPEHTGRLLISLIQDLNEEMARLHFAFEAGRAGPGEIEDAITAYSSAVERILGLPDGSLLIVEPSTLLAWFDPAAKRNGEGS